MKRSKNNLSSVFKKIYLSLFVLLSIVVIVVAWRYFKPVEIITEKPGYKFSSVKIAILNGCGQKNAATEVKDFLFDKEINNLDIISWKNVPRQMFIYEKSLIIVKEKNEEKLNFLMKLTGIQRRIYAENDQFIEEFQIILGKDYKRYFN